MDRFGAEGEPFVFVIDYESREPLVVPFDQLREHGLHLRFQGLKHPDSSPSPPSSGVADRSGLLQAVPVPYPLYRERFDRVRTHLVRGDSYLVNLTFPAELPESADLGALWGSLKAPFSLYREGHFACFSPERFVRFEAGRVTTSPMKGTAEAGIAGSRKALMKDPKEQVEHVTVVDLLRNDLSAIASDVRVPRYRYCRKHSAGNKTLWQTSSDIEGILPTDWRSRLGTLLYTLLPAGSVTGAPKKKTMEIIDGVETGPRGYYTGVFGWFDGRVLDSAVMIRFAGRDRDSGRLRYHSGGGITLDSDPEAEYRELKEKIYVPVS